jgi:predicted dinucleotide-binding enzyme
MAERGWPLIDAPSGVAVPIGGSASNAESNQPLWPHEAGGQRVIFISGDHADPKADVVVLFQDAGFAVIDLGDLATGGAMQRIHHPLAGVSLIRL